MSSIKLSASLKKIEDKLDYQHLHIEITNPDRIIEPKDLIDLKLPENINWRQGIIIEGRAPVWLYGFLVHECHPAKWVGCYDPRLGAVIVSTHSHEVSVGDILAVTLA